MAQANLPACSQHCPFSAEHQALSREAVNTNCKVSGLTQLEIKPKSTAPEADAHTTRPSELLMNLVYSLVGCRPIAYAELVWVLVPVLANLWLLVP